jgi:multiple sugar transport system permease protein
LMAASVVITLPIIIISFILQKYIVKGLTSGAVKE